MSFLKGNYILGIPVVAIFFFAFGGILFALIWFNVFTLSQVAHVLLLTYPVWLPITLGALFWYYWITYIRAKFISKQEYVLLEVRLPTDIMRTPQAMETVFDSLARRPGETTWWHVYVLGRVRPWWSFELVSIEGQIHFFIWTREIFRELVESDIYAQYPTVEINVVEDYTRYVHYDPKKMTIWGSDYKLAEPDAVPIRTYVDHKLDKPGDKEEEKVDPLNQLLEWFGSVGKGQQMWLQILIRVSRDPWQEEGKALIDEILARDPVTRLPQSSPSTDGGYSFYLGAVLSESEKKKVEAISRNIAKHGWDTGIRALYITDKEHFHPKNIYGLIYNFRPFNSNELNRFQATRWFMKYDYPWEDPFGYFTRIEARHLLDAYKRRSWFHAPYKTDYFVMTSEELATIYHFPGQVAQTPTLPRIPSIRKEAPSNLPI